ncbi:Brp/Blh family beta-carotene 15,15'-dioxygenase [Candidatus Pelagibacter ubique]|jgi:Brp/Blh family beta-carotene 15,15'-monooxygenase|uniref:Brp/Blh family beta-carotene 15,15'-dioxygenase n=1 Tax=Pelagibacter ubique TaxID=198252 RepID=UPI0003C7F269
MSNKIKKINLNHSFIFFFVVNIFCVLFFKYSNLNISPILCLLLILIIGVSHGSLDHIKGKKLLELFNIKSNYIFYITYILISAAVIATWMLLPSITLIIFLIIASYHFGKEDTEFLINDRSYFTQMLYFFKGFLIILTPLYFHFQETISIFKLLLIDNEMFYLSLNFIETNKLIQIGIVCSTLSSIFLFLKNFEIKKFAIFLDYFSILILNYYLSPLLAFTTYFCFLHSIRHSISLAIELDSNSVVSGFRLFVKKALPLTILTGIFSFITLYLLSNFYNLDSAILKIIFIGLASLTFPHILLEYFLEKKNEK